MDRQRIDKWLWHARLVRTRSAAAALASSGHVRVNGQRIDTPSRPVRVGDVLTVALDRSVRVLKVLDFVLRRGSADLARNLYKDMRQDDMYQDDARQHGLFAQAVARPEPAAPAVRDDGAGRPTKRERRELDRFLHGEDDG